MSNTTKNKMMNIGDRLINAFNTILHGPDEAYRRLVNQRKARRGMRNMYQAYAITEHSELNMPVLAEKILLDLGNDIAGRPLQVTLNLSHQGGNHKQIELYNYPQNYGDISDIICLEGSEFGSNFIYLTVRYNEDQRHDYGEQTTTFPEGWNDDTPDFILSESHKKELSILHSQSWNGATQSSTYKYGWNRSRQSFAQAVQAADWSKVLDLLSKGENPNDWQLSGASRNTAMHSAAEAAAPREVIQAMLDMGAWRNIVNAGGERPLDIARLYGHSHLFDLLEPVLLLPYSSAEMQAIQTHLHQIMSKPSFIEIYQLRLPELGPLLEVAALKMHFRVPGYYGGYRFWLDPTRDQATLVVESRSSMANGPVPRWEITCTGAERVESVDSQ
ncbi:hypothetical protein [Undibacterium sp.]|uniref:hypothetical protein n=1 Tax=Undibacterium sp. TaxID=1914977 RepID=UPI00273095DF|nr:hypothetical protein [Undibacterium sp.]MDP1978955.1 hypothetical protein [Undibacterium sp.]